MSMQNRLNFFMNQNSDLVHKLNRKVFPKDFCRTGNLFLCLRSSVHVFHSGSSFVLAIVLQNHFWPIRCLPGFRLLSAQNVGRTENAVRCEDVQPYAWFEVPKSRYMYSLS